MVFRQTPFGNNCCCCCLRFCLTASIFLKLPSHNCMTDSETPLAPRPLPPPWTGHAALKHFTDVFRRCARDIDIVSLCAAASTRVSFRVLLDLRVQRCGLCCWICVLSVVACAVGFACSALWFVLLELRVQRCGFCCCICVFRVVACAVGFACSSFWLVLLDLRVQRCGLCCWICVFRVVICAVGFACLLLCFISRLCRWHKQTTRWLDTPPSTCFVCQTPFVGTGCRNICLFVNSASSCRGALNETTVCMKVWGLVVDLCCNGEPFFERINNSLNSLCCTFSLQLLAALLADCYWRVQTKCCLYLLHVHISIKFGTPDNHTVYSVTMNFVKIAVGA
jgi:hypothetical protein